MTSRWKLMAAVCALLVALVATYANHFDNGFQFDDAHTIENNAYVRDLRNVPRFFVDATTFSSNPNNQMYRPLLTTTFAIDYYLAGNRLDPFWFHLDSFAWYVAQLVLLYFVLLHVFGQARAHCWNPAIALAATALYGFHGAHAETLNYISARSDSLSTFWLLAALLAYLKLPSYRWRGIGWFWIPLLLGLLVKQTVLVFPGLVFVYVFLFEPEGPAGRFDLLRRARIAIRESLPTLTLCGAYFWFQGWMTPESFTPGGASRYGYLITQPYVLLHYFENFILPLQLVADTDWRPLESIVDWRFAIGSLFIAAMLVVATFATWRREWRPVTFGILWFFVTLLPSSSIVPFAEVMNDHRTFLPYVGLVMAASWVAAMLLFRGATDTRAPITVAVLLLTAAWIGANAWIAYERNRIWGDGVALWKDVTEKSPRSGRGWMNYGLHLMGRGELDAAETAFAKALELSPRYSYAHVNMGIAQAARGKWREAERYFVEAVRLDPVRAEPYFYYGRFLAQQGRRDEARFNLRSALRVSPAHLHARQLLASLDVEKDALRKAELLAEQEPSEGNHLDLSLRYYREKRYADSIAAAERALQFNPRSKAALNNICIASIMLGEFERGEAAGRRALEIDPAYEWVKPNLALGRRLQAGSAPLLRAVRENPSATNYRTLGIFYYENGLFTRAIHAAEEGLGKNPGDAEMLNLACAAHNSLGQYDAGIRACERALTLKPDFPLARNNLLYARRMLGDAEER